MSEFVERMAQRAAEWERHMQIQSVGILLQKLTGRECNGAGVEFRVSIRQVAQGRMRDEVAQ